MKVNLTIEQALAAIARINSLNDANQRTNNKAAGSDLTAG
jgi:hypothetical protein